MTTETVTESTDLFAGLAVSTSVTFKKTVNGVQSAYDLSAASSITARLIGPDGPVSSTVPCASGASGANWANGVVVVVFDANETADWLDDLGVGNWLYFEVTLSGNVLAYESAAVYEIKQAHSVAPVDSSSGSRGYCTVTDVEAMTGHEFTPEQIVHCNSLIKRMETFVDSETGRGWLNGQQTNEAHYGPSANVYVKYSPVASIESITGRCGLGETEELLAVDDDYEVVSLERGYIRLTCPALYDRILVSYTQSNEMPADLKQACIEIVSSWMIPNLQPGMYGLDSLTLPDMTVRYARSHVQQAVPPLARQVLDRYGRVVHA